MIFKLFNYHLLFQILVLSLMSLLLNCFLVNLLSKLPESKSWVHSSQNVTNLLVMSSIFLNQNFFLNGGLFICIWQIYYNFFVYQYLLISCEIYLLFCLFTDQKWFNFFCWKIALQCTSLGKLFQFFISNLNELKINLLNIKSLSLFTFLYIF